MEGLFNHRVPIAENEINLRGAFLLKAEVSPLEMLETQEARIEVNFSNLVLSSFVQAHMRMLRIVLA